MCFDRHKTEWMGIIFIFCLIAFSIMRWSTIGFTAFEGPGLDMIGFFEGHENSSYLTQDFFTQASLHVNPRHIFGHFILWLNSILQLGGWYQTFFILKIIMVSFLPTSLFLFFERINGLNQQPSAKISLLNFICVSLAVLSPLLPQFISIQPWFSVAWWIPYFDYVAPHSLGFLLGLWASIATWRQPSIGSILISVVFYVAAFLIQGSVAIGFLIFNACLLLAYWGSLPKPLKANLLKIHFLQGCAGLGILLILQNYYLVTSNLSGKDIFDIYIRLAHPSHYLPSHFGSNSGYSWLISLSICAIWILSPLLITVFYYKDRPNEVLKRFTTYALIFYLGSIGLQELISFGFYIKSLILLGPARWSLFGYWLGLANLVIFLKIHSSSTKSILNQRSNLISLLTICIASTLIFIIVPKDNPRTKYEQQYSDLLNWIKINTENDAVFAVPFGALTQMIPWLGPRAIFTGTGFPFREDFYAEYASRESIMFGTPEERDSQNASWIGGAMAGIYRSRRLNDFLKAQQIYKLDYIVLENNYKDHFINFTPSFTSKDFTIYKLETLKAEPK